MRTAWILSVALLVVAIACAGADDVAREETTVWIDPFDLAEKPEAEWENFSSHPAASLTDRPGFLRLTTQISVHDPLQGAVLRSAPAEDFVIETRVKFLPSENFQRAGLAVFVDSQAFAILSHAYCGFVGAGCVGSGIYFDATDSNENFATELDIESEAWLRLTKCGPELVGEYSTDGTTWQSVGVHTLESQGTPRIGLTADGISDPEDAIDAFFDYFRVEWNGSACASSASAPSSGPEVLVVSSAADSGEGTLRDALGVAEPGDRITFDASVFPPDAPVSILLESPLPPIACGEVVIDASDAGAILDGSHAPDGSDGLLITSSGNTIRGLQIVDFPGNGIVLESEAQWNTVGGDRDVGEGPTGQGNRIASCRAAIIIQGPGTSDNTITGNVIGTQASGRGNVGNEIGIRLEETSHNIIGPNNLLAYSEGGEIEIDPGSSHNVIGPDNTFIHNLTSTIRIRGDDPLGNTITRNTFKSTLTPINLVDCAIVGPRITTLNRAQGMIAGTACPGCTVEIFTGGFQVPYVFEGSTVADVGGVFAFDKSEPFAQGTVVVNATDAEGTTSAMGAPLCRAHKIPIPREPGEIRVLSYNIQHGGISFGAHSGNLDELEAFIDWGGLWRDWAEADRLRNILELLRYANADIIAFQELMGWSLRNETIAKEVARQLGMNYVLGPEHAWGESALALGIFTRFEILESKELTSTWDGVGPPFLARLALPNGSELLVITLHMAQSRCEAPDPKVLSDLLPGYVDEQAVVLGDFNLSIARETLPCLTLGPWAVIASQCLSSQTNCLGLGPDYILVSPSLAPYATQTWALDSCVRRYEVPSGQDAVLSDHRPAEMDLVLPE